MRVRPPIGAVHALAAGLIATWRFRTVGARRIVEASRASPTGAVVVALWHQSLAAIIGPHGNFRCAALASRSGDGALIAGVLERMGYRTVRGSSARGGAQAAAELSRAVADGWFLALTVDGPRGPARIPKPGAIALARRYGIPVVPVAARANREWTFRKSWDRFRLPWPGATVWLAYGAPIWFRSAAGVEDEAQDQAVLAAAINGLEVDASRRAGWARRT
jgi:lysophospholipid acyltransferase (LPLAT)-like uncharacterized protein